MPCGSSVHVWTKSCGGQISGPGVSHGNSAFAKGQNLFQVPVWFRYSTLAYINTTVYRQSDSNSRKWFIF